MPIVKFIINSLPLEDIQKIDNKAKAIDFACGAGHFLNEVAKVFIDNEVVGIEKEYRLSKIAKVSALMYGQENINIVYDDALTKNKEIKDNSFSVLVANPPYSVKGFLETLPNNDIETYELTKTIEEKSYTVNNSIECFFMERGKQLLCAGAVAGIVLPSSILSKGDGKNTYVGTREILIKYFQIIAIAEFGSGTFGKTGTNTVTLFLKRKNDVENIVERYQDFKDNLFQYDKNTQELFKDKYLIEDYCNHIDINQDIYLSMFENELNQEIFKHKIFEEYQKSYNSLNERLKKKTKLLEYIKNIEADKIYYFCLAKETSKEVLIIKAPSDRKANKKFLGYEWSGRKGNEGIQYIGGTLNNIDTPLYNPNDKKDKSKINSLISQNFSDKNIEIPNELKEFVLKARLVDMMDFSKKDFNKAIGLNPKRKIKIRGKKEWQKKLGDVVDIKIGGTPSRDNGEYFKGSNLWVSISEMNGQIINNTKEYISEDAIKKSNVKLIPKGTTLLSFKLSIGKTAKAGQDLYTNEAIAGLIPKDENILNDYIFCLFNGKIIDLEKDGANTFGKSLNSTFLKEEVKIPLPPLDIQREIVKECEKVDKEVLKANEDIKRLNIEIDNEINEISANFIKLSELHKISSGGTPLSSRNEYYNNGDIPWVNSGEVKQGLILDTKIKINELGLKNSSAKIFPKETVLIAMYGATVGQIGILGIEASTNQAVCGLFPNKEKILPMYSYYYLNSQRENFIELSVGTARTNISQEIIKNFKIPLPPLKIQKEIVSKIEKLEESISKSQKIINEASDKKQAILKKYL